MNWYFNSVKIENLFFTYKCTISHDKNYNFEKYNLIIYFQQNYTISTKIEYLLHKA